VNPSAWQLTASDLEALGAPIDSRVLCTRITRAALGRSDAEPLGRDAAAFVSAKLDLSLPRIAQQERSDDGATKLVLELGDGARIEAVHMPRAVRNPRVTVCLSSQVGCAMGCTFCRTAGMGLVRNLTGGEITGQLIAVLRAFGPADGARVNVVFMGMGEPLHNVDAVLTAVAAMCEPAGLGLSPTRITVSTSGLVSGIDRLGRALVRPALALSVNATTDEARLRTMPITKAHGLADLRAALLRLPLRSHEKITIEYVLLRGENDTVDDARRLGAFVAGFRHHVNVIPYNAYEGAQFAAPDEETLSRFVDAAREGGCLVTVRRSRGRDVSAACGQLVQAGRARRGQPLPA
jgi:23S rRNA (adenine2503-C2)-methyltransferase